MVHQYSRNNPNVEPGIHPAVGRPQCGRIDLKPTSDNPIENICQEGDGEPCQKPPWGEVIVCAPPNEWTKPKA